VIAFTASSTSAGDRVLRPAPRRRPGCRSGNWTAAVRSGTLEASADLLQRERPVEDLG